MSGASTPSSSAVGWWLVAALGTGLQVAGFWIGPGSESSWPVVSVVAGAVLLVWAAVRLRRRGDVGDAALPWRRRWQRRWIERPLPFLDAVVAGTIAAGIGRALVVDRGGADAVLVGIVGGGFAWMLLRGVLELGAGRRRAREARSRDRRHLVDPLGGETWEGLRRTLSDATGFRASTRRRTPTDVLMLFAGAVLVGSLLVPPLTVAGLPVWWAAVVAGAVGAVPFVANQMKVRGASRRFASHGVICVQRRVVTPEPGVEVRLLVPADWTPATSDRVAGLVADRLRDPALRAEVTRSVRRMVTRGLGAGARGFPHGTYLIRANAAHPDVERYAVVHRERTDVVDLFIITVATPR